MNVSLVGVHRAGGVITGRLQTRSRIDASDVAVVGDSVAAHPPCPTAPAHCAATMARGSSRTRIDGIAMVRSGDVATCGHAANGLATDRDDG